MRIIKANTIGEMMDLLYLKGGEEHRMIPKDDPGDGLIGLLPPR